MVSRLGSLSDCFRHPVYPPSGYCAPVHTRTHIFLNCFVSRDAVLESRRTVVGGRRVSVGRVRMLYVFGGGNNGMMARLTRLRPRRGDALSPLGGASTPTRRLVGVAAAAIAGQVRGHVGITDGRLGFLPARRNSVFARASKGVHNLSDGMLPRRQLHSPRITSTRRVQHRHTAIVDASLAGRSEHTSSSGRKTHCRSMDSSNEFRCRDYLWDTC